jgi:hypothetical protein
MNRLIKHRKIIVIFLVMLSIAFGIFIFDKLSENNLKFILSSVNNLNIMNYKVIVLHLILASISFILAFIGIGIIFILIYLFFEGIVIGFMTSYYFYLYHVTGILFSLIYTIIFKLLILFLMVIVIFKYLKIFKYTIKFFKKEQINITKTIINTLIIWVVIFVNDLFLLLFGEKILNLFSFIIK